MEQGDGDGALRCGQTSEATSATRREPSSHAVQAANGGSSHADGTSSHGRQAVLQARGKDVDGECLTNGKKKLNTDELTKRVKCWL